MISTKFFVIAILLLVCLSFYQIFNVVALSQKTISVSIIKGSVPKANYIPGNASQIAGKGEVAFPIMGNCSLPQYN